jgi:hypothetical protein
VRVSVLDWFLISSLPSQDNDSIRHITAADVDDQADYQFERPVGVLANRRQGLPLAISADIPARLRVVNTRSSGRIYPKFWSRSGWRHPAATPAQSPLEGLFSASVLRFDLSSEGLGYYFSAQQKCQCEFVPIVCCFCGPENVGVIPLGAAQLHHKRRARLCKLRNEGRKKGLVASGPFNGPQAQTILHPMSNRPLYRRHRAQQTISDDDFHHCPHSSELWKLSRGRGWVFLPRDCCRRIPSDVRMCNTS